MQRTMRHDGEAREKGEPCGSPFFMRVGHASIFHQAELAVRRRTNRRRRVRPGERAGRVGQIVLAAIPYRRDAGRPGEQLDGGPNTPLAQKSPRGRGVFWEGTGRRGSVPVRLRKRARVTRTRFRFIPYGDWYRTHWLPSPPSQKLPGRKPQNSPLEKFGRLSTRFAPSKCPRRNPGASIVGFCVLDRPVRRIKRAGRTFRGSAGLHSLTAIATDSPSAFARSPWRANFCRG